VTPDHLREIFGYYGTVNAVDLKTDRKSHLSRGQATISFSTEKDAEHAMFYLDGGQIDGMVIKVSFVLVEHDRKRGPSEGLCFVLFCFVLFCFVLCCFLFCSL
jgi:RNA-binding protein with serine-rich domain 1